MGVPVTLDDSSLKNVAKVAIDNLVVIQFQGETLIGAGIDTSAGSGRLEPEGTLHSGAVFVDVFEGPSGSDF